MSSNNRIVVFRLSITHFDATQ
ncbi:hypothetical protein LINPERPRIM_LOCUS35565 [Linum perenne]